MLKKLVCFYILVMSGSVSASNVPAQAQLESFLSSMSSLSADFEQNLYDHYGDRLQQSSGTFSMKRPGKFRWDYILPYAQNIISNGKKIWMYDSELEQVNVRPYSQILASSPISLLDKNQSLSVEFTVEPMPSTKALQWVRLLPKAQENDFKEIQIGLKEGEIKIMRFVDNFDQVTEVKFEHLVVNPVLNSEIFEFTVPEGADVMGDF